MVGYLLVDEHRLLFFRHGNEHDVHHVDVTSARCRFCGSSVSTPRPSQVLLQLSGRYTNRPVMRWKGADDAVHPVR
jgi:hypothetical protein